MVSQSLLCVVVVCFLAICATSERCKPIGLIDAEHLSTIPFCFYQPVACRELRAKVTTVWETSFHALSITDPALFVFVTYGQQKKTDAPVEAIFDLVRNQLPKVLFLNAQTTSKDQNPTDSSSVLLFMERVTALTFSDKVEQFTFKSCRYPIIYLSGLAFGTSINDLWSQLQDFSSAGRVDSLHFIETSHECTNKVDANQEDETCAWFRDLYNPDFRRLSSGDTTKFANLISRAKAISQTQSPWLGVAGRSHVIPIAVLSQKNKIDATREYLQHFSQQTKKNNLRNLFNFFGKHISHVVDILSPKDHDEGGLVFYLQQALEAVDSRCPTNQASDLAICFCKLIDENVGESSNVCNLN